VERAKEVIVVDASVVVKWFVEEEDTDKALQIRQDYQREDIDLWSTQLLPFEVLNALRYNPELGEQELIKSGYALSRYQIALYPILDELRDLSVKNALRYGISIYDSSYLSLAELTHRRLYTADRKFLAKTHESGTVQHISKYVS